MTLSLAAVVVSLADSSWPQTRHKSVPAASAAGEVSKQREDKEADEQTEQRRAAEAARKAELLAKVSRHLPPHVVEAWTAAFDKDPETTMRH